MTNKTPLADYRSVLPEALHQEADALIAYLTTRPFTPPQQCPWCKSARFTRYADNYYRCGDCKRAFTPVSGTPFANCRHQEKWPVYAAYRLAGQAHYHATRLSRLASHGAGEYREKVIEHLLHERWPLLLPWWHRLPNITNDGKPAPLRTLPFTSAEDAWAHHNHEYVQCLECGRMFSSLGPHLRMVHGMRAMEYREKWQILKKIPLSGLANRRRHRDYINHQIAIGAVDPYELAGLMQEANRQQPKAKPFKTQYELEGSRQSMLERQPWHISPAIKIVDESVKRAAALRMQQRHETGESAKSIARAFGVWPNTVYVWEKQFTPEDSESSTPKDHT